MEDQPNKLPVTIALPPSLKAQLDAEARRQDRSRSWISAEAIRKYLAAHRAFVPNDPGF